MNTYAQADSGVVANNVFFLAPAWWPVTATRTCTVPADKMLFIPAYDLLVTNLGLPPASQLTDDQLKSLSATYTAAVPSLTLEIDGKSYGSTMSDFAPYFSGPTQLSFTIPNTPSNIYNTVFCGSNSCSPATFSGLISDSYVTGWWFLLAPLSTGNHTIRFGMHQDAIASQGVTASSQDVTYDLTVE